MNGSPALASLLWATGVLVPLSFLLSLLSALLERSGPIRLRHWAEQGGKRLRALYDSRVAFGLYRSFLSLLSRLLPVALFAVLAALLDGLHRAHPATWSGALILVGMVIAETVNRWVVGRDPETALRHSTLLYRILLGLFTPFLVLLTPLLARWLAPGGSAHRRDEENHDETASDEEIEAFIDVGTREGILEPQEGEMLWSIVDFGDTQARSVMTPRIDIVCAAVETPLDGLAERFVESGHSRLPIYEDSIDRILGILHIRDVLRALRSPSPPTVRELIKPPLFIPETKPLGELLRELQRRFQPMAVVVDEYGGTAGLVTVEDLLEEIVGEIMDEHDALVAELMPQEDGSYRLDGRAHIELLDELFQVDLEDPEYETVAGLIFTELGHVPQPGEVAESHGLRFTVEAVADRRIEWVRVERIDSPGAAVETT
jgi:putative hemolysin